jgi:dTDP-4-dehydrorhamnose 3,5-epimerase
MVKVSLDDIRVTTLAKVVTNGGDVMHAMKSSDANYKGFGEVYFSWIEQGVIKAWKCHNKMTMNLICPLGEVRFVFQSPVSKDEFRVENIGEEKYVRLTVPPGIWFGFQGQAKDRSLLANIADIAHQEEEVTRRKKDAILFNWDFL